MDELMCNMCSGQLVVMGQLGNIMHLKCRACGLGHFYNMGSADEDFEEDKQAIADAVVPVDEIIRDDER